MDTGQLEQMDEWSWNLRNRGAGAPVLLYGSEDLLRTMDDRVLEQIRNVASLPGLVGRAMTMPDAHWGYGFPIGGVAAFDPEEGGIISAGGVGFDISCGIRTLRTDLEYEEIQADLHHLADELFRRIPAGVGEGGSLRLDLKELDRIIRKGAEWAVESGYGNREDLEYVEEHGRIRGAVAEHISETAKKRQRGEMGTLGSGNHYLEVQRVEEIYDESAARAFGLRTGRILVSIHCGSRGLGHQIGTEYMVSLAKAAQRLGIHLPDRELACAPIRSPEGEAYFGAMNGAINVALANRQILTHLTREAFEAILPGARLETLYDVSHNTCKVEDHMVGGGKRRLYIHRKGATRALGPHHDSLPARYRESGQPVLIGGSMGTASYILAGTEKSEGLSFASASHGAGRAMSRKQALKQWDGRDLIRDLGEKGILIRTRSYRGAAEEAPGAYKNVDQVALATEGAGLARRVARLRPLACIKG